MSSHGRPREADIGAGSHDGAETERPASPPAAEIAALRDQLLRALAETENTRRQATRAASDARKYSISGFAREMLAVSDNLQRTLAAANLHPSGGDAALVEGVRATGRMLESVFDRFGLRKVEALGTPSIRIFKKRSWRWKTRPARLERSRPFWKTDTLSTTGLCVPRASPSSPGVRPPERRRL